MCLTTVDVTHIAHVEPGDEVVLLGRQGTEEITADELAEKIGTISYEVFCSLGGYRSKRFVNAAVD
jgi:alanine racemase